MVLPSLPPSIQTQTYTFYASRDEFVSTHRRFDHWVCVATESGVWNYQTQDVDEAWESGEARFGDLVFAAPGCGFNRRALEGPLRYHVLQWDFANDSTRESPPWLAGKWPVRDWTRLRSTFDVLRPLLGRSDAWSLRRRTHLLEELLLEAWNSRAEPRGLDPLMNQAAQLMRERAGQSVAMSAISGELGLGAVQFTRRFRAAWGTTPIEFWTRIRLEQAQKMLIETSDTLDEIAAACGWSSGAYLSAVFEKQFGTTPGRFRRTHRV